MALLPRGLLGSAKILTPLLLVESWILGTSCTYSEKSSVILANSTIHDNGHIHQVWRHPDHDVVVYRVIIEGSGDSIPPPLSSTFEAKSDHEEKYNNTDIPSQSQHPRDVPLTARADVWKGQAHTKMYNNQNGPYNTGTEAYWEFHTDSGGDKWIEVVVLTSNTHSLKWVTYNHNGGLLSDCWTVQTQYEQYGYGQNPDDDSWHYSDMVTEHQWIFWNRGSSQKYCKCIADCRRCTK